MRQLSHTAKIFLLFIAKAIFSLGIDCSNDTGQNFNPITLRMFVIITFKAVSNLFCNMGLKEGEDDGKA